MFEKTKTRRELKKLRTMAAKTAASYEKDRVALNCTDEIEQSHAVEFQEVGAIYEEISVLKTKQILEEASELGVLISYGPSWWERSNQTGTRFLSETGLAELRKLIRVEKDYRLEVFGRKIQVVFTLITILTGLVGSLAGLAAVLGFQLSK
jgi:hypothetical protein